MSSRRGQVVPFPAVVLVDSREQLPYSFAGLKADAKQGGGPLLIELKGATLQAGDYSLWQHADQVAVERKSKADLFGTIGQGRGRFERELQRLAGYAAAAIVVEAEWSEILADPPRHSDLSPKVVFRSVVAWQQRFPAIHWWFVPGRRMGEVTTFRVLERYWKDHASRDSRTNNDTAN